MSLGLSLLVDLLQASNDFSLVLSVGSVFLPFVRRSRIFCSSRLAHPSFSVGASIRVSIDALSVNLIFSMPHLASLCDTYRDS